MGIPSMYVSALGRCVQTDSDSYATPRPVQNVDPWCIELRTTPMWPDAVGYYLYGAQLLLLSHFLPQYRLFDVAFEESRWWRLRGGLE
eukprot:7242008-Pyramimonas_sp.AAC.1